VKSVPIEEPIVVDRKAIEKLTEGLLSHYLPDLYSSKQALLELKLVFKSHQTLKQTLGLHPKQNCISFKVHYF
jgi:hypothetical protein